jgi:5-methylcytosine-specific restriction enzyme subunit McrC
MLTYAFTNLNQSNYSKIESENFENIFDMMAEIISIGVSQQIKHGLYKTYNPQNDNMHFLKGKLDLDGTIKNRINHNIKLGCDFDELNENNLLNQIIKTTLVHLLKHRDVKKERKCILKKPMSLS